MKTPAASIVITLLGYLLGYLGLDGTLTDGVCGDFGTHCMGLAVLLGSVCWLVSLFVAIGAFWRGAISWLHWLALLLCGAPLLGLAWFGLRVLGRM